MKKPRWKRAAVAVAAVAMAAVGCSGPGSPNIPQPSGGGIVGVNPDIQVQPGAQTRVMRYGPYNIPASTATREGQIWNRFAPNIQKPCTDCYIVGMQASLKLPDGRVANHDTGQMLHHMVLASRGTGKTDPTCGSFFGTGQRFFASGNERTRVLAPAGFGYEVNTGDVWTMIYDLMNMNTTPQPVTIEMTFQYVPKSTPGMRPVTPVWLDVAQCLTSEVPARTGSYSYTYNWTVNVPGRLMGIGGHVHDGGTYMNIRRGNELICNSVAGYGGPGFESGGHGDHGGGDHGSVHLSSMSQCIAPNGNQPVARLQRGQVVTMTAYYDTNVWAQHGTHPVMGIAVGFIAPD